MKIYHYNPVTGVFLGDGLADPSPLEDDVWLIPAHATTEAPPTAGDGQQVVRINDQWHVEPIPAPVVEPDPIVRKHPDLTLLSPAEKLAAIGLSIDDLKALLAS